MSKQILCIKENEEEGFEKNQLYELTGSDTDYYRAKNEDGYIESIDKEDAILADYPFKVKCVDNSKFQKGYDIGKIYPVIAETENEYYIKSNTGNIHGLKKSRFIKELGGESVQVKAEPKTFGVKVTGAKLMEVKEKIVYVDRPVYKTIEKPVYIDRPVPTPVAKTTVSIKNNDEKIINNKKGGVKMNKLNKMFGEFGKVNEGEVALTITGGVAVKRKNGDYVRFNTETEQIENQMDIVLGEASDMLFAMPVQEVQAGDIIKVRSGYFQVLNVLDNNNLRVADIKNGVRKTIIKEVNLFGMGFWTKIVSLFNMNGTNGANGGFNPMMLMLMNDKEGGDSGFDMKDMFMMSALSGQTGAGGMNPMMMMMMMKDGKGSGTDMKDMLMMSALGGGQFNLGNLFGGTPTTTTTKPIITETPTATTKADDIIKAEDTIKTDDTVITE